MPAKYWIKLYHEILQDPKMGRLPDNLWRRAIELFLLAGELSGDQDEDEKGHLPETDEIAWLIRQPESSLFPELSRLAEVGILTKTDSGWLVTNFAKRQKHIDTAERMRQYRERKRLKELQGSDKSDKQMVTRRVTKRNIESDKDIESKGEKEIPPNGDGKPSKPKMPNEAQVMFSALADLCGYDIALLTEDSRGALNQAEKRMREKGYTPADVVTFGEWWAAHDWRGKQGQSPTLTQVREKWGEFKKRQKIRGDGDQSPDLPDPPALSPEQVIWQQVLADSPQIPQWLAAEITPIPRTNGTFKLAVSNDNAKQWIDNRLMKVIKPTLNRIDDSIKEIEVIIQ